MILSAPKIVTASIAPPTHNTIGLMPPEESSVWVLLFVVSSGVSVTVGAGVDVGVGIGVAVGFDVGVAVGIGVAVGFGVGVDVGQGVGVASGAAIVVTSSFEDTADALTVAVSFIR